MQTINEWGKISRHLKKRLDNLKYIQELFATIKSSYKMASSFKFRKIVLFTFQLFPDHLNVSINLESIFKNISL